jgi:hypothetical protein
MNDFTKEELEEIAHNFGEIRAWSDTLERSWPLLDKIQSMIDSYCEHDYQPCLGKINIDMCRNCLRIK